MIRHPASLDRVPVGPVPPLQRYYQDATISCLPSRRTSFPSLGGTTVASAIRSVWLEMPKPPAGGVEAFAGHPPSRPSCRGKGRTSQVPARPQWPVRHALRLRRNRTRLAMIAAATWPPLREPRGLPQGTFGAQYHGFQARCLRFEVRVTPTRRKTRFRPLARRYRVGFSPTGSPRKVSATHSCSRPPFAGLAWRDPSIRRV